MGDIILGNFQDSYKNLTLKSLMALKWTHKYCPAAKYLLSCDDDVIINFQSMIDVLESSEPKTNTIWGRFTLILFTNRHGKHEVTFSDYPFLLYPPYMRGAGYVLSGDIIGLLFRTSEYVPLIPIDDVYVTGILARILNINLYNENSSLWRNFIPSACDIITKKLIVSVFFNVSQQLDTWEEMRTAKDCENVDAEYNCGYLAQMLFWCPHDM